MNPDTRQPGEARRRWLDEPVNVTRLYRGLWGVGAILLLADLWVHRHEAFSYASSFGFHGLFGFGACVVLVLSAKRLRRVVMRREDYYD